MPIATNYRTLQNFCNSKHAQLVVVSKQQPAAAIMQVYEAGGRMFGENHASELHEKAEQLPADVQWHFIGHLQTNKVKTVVNHAALIHSVDSLRLLTEINKQALKLNKVQDCLLQLYIADEETKHGLQFDECVELLRGAEFAALQNICIRGVMAMATNTTNLRQLNSEFYELHMFYQGLKQAYFSTQENFNIISAGMSNDYEIALANGANMLRLGSAIFAKAGIQVNQ